MAFFIVFSTILSFLVSYGIHYFKHQGAKPYNKEYLQEQGILPLERSKTSNIGRNNSSGLNKSLIDNQWINNSFLQNYLSALFVQFLCSHLLNSLFFCVIKLNILIKLSLSVHFFISCCHALIINPATHHGVTRIVGAQRVVRLGVEPAKSRSSYFLDGHILEARDTKVISLVASKLTIISIVEHLWALWLLMKLFDIPANLLTNLVIGWPVNPWTTLRQ